MYADMDEWAEIRKRVLIGGESKRAILRETRQEVFLPPACKASEPASTT